MRTALKHQAETVEYGLQKIELLKISNFVQLSSDFLKYKIDLDRPYKRDAGI